MIDWYVEGIEFGNCNCLYGCPCQFEGLPTHGHCRGFEVVRIERGHFGEVVLDGLRAAMLYAWPGPVFEGKGELQVIVDERAEERQRAALVKILHGEETDEGATHWWVYRAMSDTVHPTLYLPIEFEVDLEARTARVDIPGVLESVGSPIKSPATGQQHRVRIEIPNGIEFERAEVAIATTRAIGAIPLDLADTYGQFNELRHSGRGVVHG
ncbi:MAG: DUF1326 domain-containing protein [Thermoanaerobaculia bacterium]